MDRIPFLFGDNLEAFANWRARLAKGLGVDPSAVIVTGSSAFGVSLNPHKNYKIFDERSDIDVAVISDFHFVQAWHSMRNLGSSLFKLAPAAQQAVRDHSNRLIYWGTIATDKILEIMPFSEQWSRAIEEQSKVLPTVGRKINARIYRDHASLREYQVNNLKALRNSRLEGFTQNV